MHLPLPFSWLRALAKQWAIAAIKIIMARGVYEWRHHHSWHLDGLNLLKQLFDHDYVALGLSIVALLIVLFGTHHFR